MVIILHLLSASMIGMIAQWLVLRAPDSDWSGFGPHWHKVQWGLP